MEISTAEKGENHGVEVFTSVGLVLPFKKNL